ncbi:MAG: TonB-dependent receptor [Allosphingosinicella sp.]|uniref:TonB-dependent receptor n=1 Tax=Allosphingosinicella sp. TaxID=2823234 RepID=UPI003958A2F5
MAASAILPLVLSAAAAQPSEIVVTGRGLEAPAGERVYAAVEIGRDRLAASPSNRLDELLREVPGFQLFRRSDARSANPTAQGATLRALGGNASSRALLLLDGVPQTDPFGGWVAWPAYDPRRLGAVRVVRGGGTGAAGPGALAGTIELESAAPADLAGLGGGIFYGSRNAIDAFAAAGLDLGEGFVSVSGAWMRGDGFVPVVAAQRGPVDRPSPYDQKSLSARAVAPIAPGTELQAALLLFDDRRERGTDLSDVRSEGADASLRLVGRDWSALAYVQTRDFYTSFAAANPARDAVSRTAEQYGVPATGLGVRLEARPRLGPVELRVGGDWRGAEGRTQERFQFVAGTGTRQRLAGGRTDTFGLYAEGGWERGPLTLHGGGRIDRWRISDGRLLETVFATGERLTDAAFPDRSGWLPTGRGGIAYRAAEPLTLRAAAYLGWRLPTLNELYRPFRVGPDATAANADLDPERLKGIEAGADFAAGGMRLGATFFLNRLDDAIANVTLGRGPGTFPGVGFVAGEYRQRRNLDAVTTRGVEIDGEIVRGPWRLAAGYSFADAGVRARGPAAPLDGLRPAQAPRHSFAGTLGWRSPMGHAAALSARYVGAQFEDDLNRDRLAPALTFDALAGIALSPAMRLEARAENLLDAKVEAGISGAGIVERATPRTLWIGVRWGG